MHSHDLDTIAALADGSLAHARRPEAERLVAECDVCREEYEAQAFVLGALSDIEPARLSDIERARLHQAVAQLEPLRRQEPRFQFSWLPRLAVAAAALAFVGAFGALFFTGNSDTAQPEAAADAADTLAEPAEALTQAAPTTAAATAAMEAPAATEAAAAAEEDAAGASRNLDILYFDLGEVTDLEDLEFPPGATLTNLSQPARDETYAREFACLAEAADVGPIAFAATAIFDGTDIEYFQSADTGLVLEAADCSQLKVFETGSK